MNSQGRVILDLRGLLLHSYYSGTPLDTVITENGDRKPKAIHGIDQFIRLYLQPILETTAPIDIIAVQEGQGSNSRRRAWYSKYKERAAQDSDSEIVKEQMELMYVHARKLLLALGCILVKTPFCEADDTIAYLVQRLKGGKVVHTVDNDLLQLVKPGNNAVFIIKGKYTTTFKGMSLQPHNPVAIYKAICGDSSDGFIGVRGVGEKAWEGMVAEFGLDGMIELEQLVKDENFSELESIIKSSGNKTLQKIYEQRSELSTSYKLSQVHPEWCESNYGDRVIRPKWEKRVPTIERLRDALDPLGLSFWIEQFKKYTVQTWLLDSVRLARAKRPELIAAMRKSRFLPFDYETYDALKHSGYQQAKRGGGYVDMLNSKITGCSFSFGDNMQFCFYMPVKHRDTHNCKLDDLKDLFDSLEGCDFVAHNNGFEQVISKMNMDLEFPRMFDSMIMGHYVDENIRGGLKGMSKSVLNYNQTNYTDIVPHGKDMRDVSGEEVLSYGCDDSITCAHMSVLYKIIMECEQTWDFYEENETYFEKALMPGFIKGVPMDYTRLKELEDADRALFETTDVEMRSALLEHCSEVNEDGFNNLWVEIQLYEEKALAAKEKSPDEIASILVDKKAALRPQCKYTPNEPPILTAKKTHISRIAKSLNMPTIRSLKEEWIETYYQGIKRQVETGAATASQEQLMFLELVHMAVTSGTDDDIDNLEAWMSAYVAHDKTMWSGDLLNTRSPTQMAALFYGKLGLPILVRNTSIKGKATKREIFELEGAPSTSENAIRTWLSELSKDDWRYRVLENVLTLRGINTRNSLYYKPYPLWASPIDGRMHPQIRNCGTVTRRPIGTSPNVLQVSKTKDEGHTRSVFLPQSADQEDVEQEVIVSIDFVQQELVILAGESNDATLRACYTGPIETRSDVHTATGLTIFRARNPQHGPVDYAAFQKMAKDEDKLFEENRVADQTRRPFDIRKVYAKRTNFLASYGGGAIGLARKLIVPKQVAEDFLDSFFASYPKVKDYQERCARQALRHGFVETCFGNRRHLYMVHDKNKAIAKSAERQAGNYPIQGGAADVLKIVLREFVKRRIAEITGCTLFAPIYDELVLSCPVSKVYILVEMLADIMEMELPGLNIKLDTSVSIGKNWGEQNEIGSRPTEQAVNDCLYRIFNPKEAREAA